jgi:pimeloyl-ACP methyl ester carboxylesterase
MEALRTPDERFSALPDFPYAPRYVDDLPGCEGLRAHYVDEGPADADVFLCLHGEPTWAYLYRRMIPVFLAGGGRVVAPDYFGFGRSDKPVDDAAYSFSFHRHFLLALVRRLDLRGVTLVAQDWGGLLGFTLPLDTDFRSRLKRLIVMNTALADGRSLGPGFDAWRAFAFSRPNFEVGDLMGRAVAHLTPAERAAYDAPFPDDRYKAGVRAFPHMVMTDPDQEGVAESRAAAAFWAEAWKGRSFMAYGGADGVFPPASMEALRVGIRGCPPALVLPEAGHFVQEWGRPIAEAALASFRDQGAG